MSDTLRKLFSGCDEPGADVNDKEEICGHGSYARACKICTRLDARGGCKHDWHPLACDSYEYEDHYKMKRKHNTVIWVFCKRCLETKKI